jgi:hypothetical protein
VAKGCWALAVLASVAQQQHANTDVRAEMAPRT